MKLWMLAPTKNGFKQIASNGCENATVIVRAETEIAARNIAQHETKLASVKIWYDRELSICDELSPVGDAEVVVEMIEPTE